MTALGEAGEALAQDSPDTESPSYLYWMDAGELQVMEARVYTELRRPLRAVPFLTNVLGRYDASHARELALYLSWLAVAYADANEPEAAAGTAGRMLALGQSGSERTAERTRIVLDRLRASATCPRSPNYWRPDRPCADSADCRCLRHAAGLSGVGPSSVEQLRCTRVLRGPPRLTV
ncbi:hypothetical protein [Streptacidiphilus cavernicola]|uniref:Bacterial transcriptional activator domain-containing protein n=1 Tax=Streptacidiphilus cavernicola TaxID=3342716 RepID=A0ABV6W4G8_9ACTN